MEEMDRQLRESPGTEPAPTDLHDSIMQALKSQRSAPTSAAAPRRIFGGTAWVAFPAAAVCLVIGLLLSSHQRPRTSGTTNEKVALAAPAAALDLPENLTATLPAALALLSDELTRVQSDLDRTADFLAASLP